MSMICRTEADYATSVSAMSFSWRYQTLCYLTTNLFRRGDRIGELSLCISFIGSYHSSFACLYAVDISRFSGLIFRKMRLFGHPATFYIYTIPAFTIADTIRDSSIATHGASAGYNKDHHLVRMRQTMATSVNAMSFLW